MPIPGRPKLWTLEDAELPRGKFGLFQSNAPGTPKTNPDWVAPPPPTWGRKKVVATEKDISIDDLQARAAELRQQADALNVNAPAPSVRMQLGNILMTSRTHGGAQTRADSLLRTRAAAAPRAHAPCARRFLRSPLPALAAPCAALHALPALAALTGPLLEPPRVCTVDGKATEAMMKKWDSKGRGEFMKAEMRLNLRNTGLNVTSAESDVRQRPGDRRETRTAASSLYRCSSC